MFIGLAIVCDDYFVPALDRIADGKWTTHLLKAYWGFLELPGGFLVSSYRLPMGFLGGSWGLPDGFLGASFNSWELPGVFL